MNVGDGFWITDDLGEGWKIGIFEDGEHILCSESIVMMEGAAIEIGMQRLTVEGIIGGEHGLDSNFLVLAKVRIFEEWGKRWGDFSVDFQIHA